MLSLLLLCPALAWPAPAPELPARHLPVPLVRQKAAYTCGPAALLAVLRYWKVFKGEEDELQALLGTSREEGTHPKSLKNVAAAYGLSSRLEEDMTLKSLVKALKKGETAIVDMQAWRKPGQEPWEDFWEAGHYVVLVGKDSHFLYVMDPCLDGSYGYIPREEFEARWHDYANEGGRRREYRHAAVLISGKEHLRTFPEIERVD